MESLHQFYSESVGRWRTSRARCTGVQGAPGTRTACSQSTERCCITIPLTSASAKDYGQRKRNSPEPDRSAAETGGESGTGPDDHDERDEHEQDPTGASAGQWCILFTTIED